MTKRRVTFLLAVLLTGVHAVSARSPRAVLYLSSNRAVAGETVTLNVEVSGAGSVGDVSVRRPPGVSVKEIGRSLVTRIINNSASQSTVVSFSLSASRPGAYTIGPASVETDEGTISTSTVRFVVEKSPIAPSGLPRDLSIQVEIAPNGPVYLHEPVLVTWRLIMPARQVQRYRVEIPWLFDFKGFKVYDPLDLRKKAASGAAASMVEMRIGDRSVLLSDRTVRSPEGKTRILELKRVLVPLETGTFPLESSYAVMEMVVGRRPGASIFSTIFDEDIITRRFEAQSPAYEIEVLPLPSQDRPGNFSGAVGDFSLSADLTPRKCRQGETVTLNVIVEGKGDVSLVPAPQIRASEDFSVLDAEQEVVRKLFSGYPPEGRKVFRMPVYVSGTGKVRIPPVEMTFFDPWKKTYKTVSAGPFVIDAEPSSKGVVNDFGKHPGTRKNGPTETGKDICGIISDVEILRDQGPLISRSPVTAGLAALFAVSFAAGLAGRRRRLLSSDPATTRRRSAWKRFRKALSDEAPPEAALKAFRQYVSDISGGETGPQAAPDEIAETVRAETAEPALADETADLLHRLEDNLYKPGSTPEASVCTALFSLAERIEKARKGK